MEKDGKKQTTKKSASSQTKKNTQMKKNVSETSKKTNSAKKSNTNNKNSKKTKIINKVEENNEKVVVKTKMQEKVLKEDLKVKPKKERIIISKEKDNNFFSDNSEITNLIKIVIAITAIFLVFYLITWVVTKDKEKSEETSDVSIQYNDILLGNLLSQKKDNYYVLAYETDDLYSNTYNMFISMYNNKSDSLKFYYSDLGLKFNQKYYDEESEETNVMNFEKLKLNTTTLFKISNGKIESAYEGADAIIDYLSSISK